MYAEYETPIFNISIFHYDTEYDISTAETVFETLDKYGMGDAEKIFAGRLTKNRYIPAKSITKSIFTKAYAEKNVIDIGMANGDGRKITEFWKVDWRLTYYKESKKDDLKSTFIPWNVLSICSTYGRLREKSTYDAYMSCALELIQKLDPFYAKIDDVDNCVGLMDKAREKHFVPDKIQCIYWGNYFGKQYCDKFKEDYIANIPAYSVKKIGDGVFFTLSESIFDFNSPGTKAMRRKLKKYLSARRFFIFPGRGRRKGR